MFSWRMWRGVKPAIEEKTVEEKSLKQGVIIPELLPNLSIVGTILESGTFEKLKHFVIQADFLFIDKKNFDDISLSQVSHSEKISSIKTFIFYNFCEDYSLYLSSLDDYAKNITHPAHKNTTFAEEFKKVGVKNGCLKTFGSFLRHLYEIVMREQNCNKSKIII